MDIGYGDCKSIGGACYVLLLVGRATCFSWVYALWSLNHKEIINVLLQFVVDVRATPHCAYMDFDPKLLEGKVLTWFCENSCKLHASPSGWQSQNGLVEWAWQTAMAMAQSYIMDMQMPHEYWYWAVCHAIQISNYFPSTVNGFATTSFELAHGVKPDYCVLFHLFSTGFFHHVHDGVHA